MTHEAARRAASRPDLRLHGFLAACLLLFAALVRAETLRLDDSLSQVFPPVAEWAWEPGSIRSGSTRLQMQVRVNVRIDTRNWAGRPARVYMVLPLEGGAPVTAEWETQGPMLGGRLVSGERALVFSGNIPGPWLEDTMRVRLTTDTRLARESVNRLAFHFEIDTP